MDLIVRLGNREEKVRVRRSDEGFEVVVGDRAYRVDAAVVQNGVRSLRLDGKYPSEIVPLARELNALLDSNQQIIERARTQVGNVAP